MIDEKFFRRVVGSRIRYLRTLKNIAQEKFARQTELDPSVFCRIENGSRRLDIVEALRVAQSLGVTVDELLAMPQGKP
jgi:transcriptional regulator with XRE-family HTH domain